jgi:hypothetical protein
MAVTRTRFTFRVDMGTPDDVSIVERLRGHRQSRRRSATSFRRASALTSRPTRRCVRRSRLS